jgi:hypothetical protein
VLEPDREYSLVVEAPPGCEVSFAAAAPPPASGPAPAAPKAVPPAPPPPTTPAAAAPPAASDVSCGHVGFMSCSDPQVKSQCCPNGTIQSCRPAGTSGGLVITGLNCVPAPPKPRQWIAPEDRGRVALYYDQAAYYRLSYNNHALPVGHPCGTDHVFYTWEGGDARPPICITPGRRQFLFVREFFQACAVVGTSSPMYTPGPPERPPSGSRLDPLNNDLAGDCLGP